MASRLVASGRVIAASKGKEWPTTVPDGTLTPDQMDDLAVVHYTAPPARGFVVDPRFGVRFRVVDKLDSVSGWMDTATITAWLGVKYSRLMELVIAGVVDCAVERGSPVRAFRILNNEAALALRSKALRR